MSIQRVYLAACAAAAIVCGAFMSAAYPALAETRITDGTIAEHSSWVKQGSPYILEDVVTVMPGAVLSIEPGVVVRGDPDLIQEGYDLPYIHVNGSLNALGTHDDHIVFEGFWGISVDHGELKLSHADVHLSNGLRFGRSSARISSSTISGGERGITVDASDVVVEGSRIEDNGEGVVVERPEIPFLVRGPDAIGGIGNAVEGEHVFITRSAIVGNASAGVANPYDIPVDARNNWWGSEGGPYPDGENSARGNVEYSPWLTEDPTLAPHFSACCSSVLFLPGLEATRLHAGTNRLWEPNRNADVEKLYLDKNGSSTYEGIYAGQPIGFAFGMVGVYGTFMRFLDGLAQSGDIAEWRAFGYDWRKPVAGVVAGKERRATTTESLIDTIEDLASRSKTGKVTIIAHSNGGLVAKEAVRALVEAGKEGLVSSVISAAVPYIGTPEAIGALLFGDGQSLGFGTLMRRSVAQQLGINMPSAYSLLPTAEYYARALLPTVVFASSTEDNVTDAEHQSTFIESRGGNPALMAAAEALHSVLDPFAWPASIARYAVVGWNRLTARGLSFFERRKCSFGLVGVWCSTVPVHEPVETTLGDGTVVVTSAAFESGQTAAMDLQKVGELEGARYAHMDILESEAAQEAIRGMIQSEGSDAPKTFDLPEGMSWSLPAPDHEREYVVVSTHSPVDLHIYDSRGRHTGPIDPPAVVEDDVFSFYEEEIPGSAFVAHGEGDEMEEYVYLPADRSEDYTISVKGTGVGEFTLVTERVHAGVTLDSSAFWSLPTTPLLSATASLMIQQPEGESGPGTRPLASSTTSISLDLDGDGTTDTSAKPDIPPNPTTTIRLLRSAAASLLAGQPKAPDILKRLDKLERMLERGALKRPFGRTEKRIEKAKERIRHVSAQKMSPMVRAKLIELFDGWISLYE